MRVLWGLMLLLGSRSVLSQSGDASETFASAPSSPYVVGPEPSSTPPSDLYFQESISYTADQVYVGNGGCSPSAVADYLQIAPFIVPTVEIEHLAMRFWQAQPSAGTQTPPMNVTYFDLVNGLLILTNQLQNGVNIAGGAVLNFTTQVSSYNYTVLSPTQPDLTAYNATIAYLLGITQGLADGSSNNPCAPGDSSLDSAVTYLQFVQRNVSERNNTSGGLTPTEIPLPSGCIEEIDANYEGDNVSGVITNGTFITADTCCQKCKANPQCNVFVYCPNFGGCTFGSNQTFPFQGCQLKHQAGLVTGSSTLPLAYQRGPPTQFASGRLSG